MKRVAAGGTQAQARRPAAGCWLLAACCLICCRPLCMHSRSRSRCAVAGVGTARPVCQPTSASTAASKADRHHHDHDDTRHHNHNHTHTSEAANHTPSSVCPSAQCGMDCREWHLLFVLGYRVLHEGRDKPQMPVACSCTSCTRLRRGPPAPRRRGRGSRRSTRTRRRRCPGRGRSTRRARRSPNRTRRTKRQPPASRRRRWNRTPSR